MYEKFVGLYPVQKTLKFELKPIGRTLQNINKNNVIADDEYKAEDYKKVKKIMDEYHKEFIEKTLQSCKLSYEKLKEYYELSLLKEKEKAKKLQEELRKEIVYNFIKQKNYKKLFSKEIIKELLPTFVSNENEQNLIEEFDKFTTYFKGFHESRKNMYTSDEKSTAIAYRLINENLLIFINNIQIFDYASKVLDASIFKKIYNDLSCYIQAARVEDLFELGYFNSVLTQKGIDIYNQLIGGVSLENETKIKGLNEYINEYKQNNPQDKKISKLNILYKQILGDKSTESFVIDNFKNDLQVIDAIREISTMVNENIINCEDNLESLLSNLEKYDLEKIYIKNDSSLGVISNYLYGDWSTILQALFSWYDSNYKTEKDKSSFKYEEKRKLYIKSMKNLSIKFLNEVTEQNGNPAKIQNYFKDLRNSDKEIFKNINERYSEINSLINNTYSENKRLKQDEKSILMIKGYLDSLKELEAYIKPLMGARFDLSLEKDNSFYDGINKYWDELQIINPLYNKVRNYLTGKIYSSEKIKLNFRNPNLLAGWAKNNEIANSGLIFKKDEKYYLGIINNKFNAKFKFFPSPKDNNDILYKMQYLQTADPQKDVQNLMVIDGKTVKKNGRKDEENENKILEELKNKYLPLDINNIRKNKTYSKLNENFSRDDLVKFIDYYKERVCEYYDQFSFEFEDSKDYNDFGEFTNHVNEQAYQILFEEVSNEYINQLVEEGNLYLFQIYNKDFSKYSKGKENLHTLYWKMLFDEKNLNNVVYKLNGEAEIFYRKASIDRKITHYKNQILKNKNELNPKKESEFGYDLIKNKRFTEDKFQFHVPITLNFKNKNINNINEFVNKEIKANKENYIIGIDRGERNLLYLVLIDSNGKIIEQYSLNNIENEYKKVKYLTNYHNLLDTKEKAMKQQRESWQSIDNIKELKEGYLSQVINKITNLMIKYNALIVIEDLNNGFIRGRQKVEKQVYQKFEKMLIDKLNYLVKKDMENNVPGGLLNAYQLTNKFETFKKLGKQSGFLFYIPAWNTSKMDPVTGFVNLFYIKYKNEKQAKDFINKIDSISFNKQKDYFEFDIDYNKFTLKSEGCRTAWTLCTNGKRVITYRNKEKNNEWDNKEIILSEEFKKLFEKYTIDIYSNIKSQILKIEEKSFWEELLSLFKAMLQMRNSFMNSEIDNIVSPVADIDGRFFDSSLGVKGLPENADANGAYNIARKGLWIVNQIKNIPDEGLKKIRLAVSNKEWLDFIQNKKWE